MSVFRTIVAGAAGVLAASACVTGPQPVERKPVAAAPGPAAPVAPPKPRPPPEPAPSERLAKAKQLVQARDYTGARTQLAKVLEKQPQHFEALFLNATCLDQLGSFDDAVAAYQKALAVDPASEGALLNLGMVYKRRGQYEEAIALYTKALEADPENVRIRNNLGVIYRLAKKYDEAEKTLRRVLARRPGNPDAYKNMVVLFMDQEKYDLAEQFSMEAKKLDEKDAGVWNNLGLIYLRKNNDKPVRALNAFYKAVELDPNNVSARQNIAAIALRFRDYKTAEEHSAKAVELEPNAWEIRLAYAYSLEGMKKLKECIAEYDKALELRGGAEDALTAEVVWAQGQAAKAAQLWSVASEKVLRYKGMKSNEKYFPKVDGELQGIDYMLKLQSGGGQPAPAPAIGAPGTTGEIAQPDPGAPAPTGAGGP